MKISSMLAIILSAFVFFTLTPPQAQKRAEDQRMDDSDWWSVANDKFVAPNTKPGVKAFTLGNFKVLGNGFDEADLFSIQDPLGRISSKLGAARVVQRGDASTWRSQICYKSTAPGDEYFVFETGEESDLVFYLFSGGPSWTGMDRCAALNVSTPKLSTSSGVHLGLTRAQLAAILGKPTFSDANRTTYYWTSRRKTPKDALTKLRSQNPEISEAKFNQSFAEYNLAVIIETRFSNDKLSYLSVLITTESP
jgi:hypothetical protein